jgi:hypothetical protein
MDPQTTRVDSSDHETERRRTEQTSDIFPKLMNSLDRIEACLKELIRQNQQQESSPQDIDAECSILTTRELAGNPDKSVERLRDILGDEPSIPTRRISVGAPGPDNCHSTVEPDIPLVNAVYIAKTMAREQSDNLEAQTEHPSRSGSAPPWQSNVDPRVQSPSQHRRSPRTLRIPQGQSHDRSYSHIPSVEALPGVETDRRATSTAPGRREARIDDSNIAYYSPDPTVNYMMDGSLPQEGIYNDQLSPHSILNTPAPRTPIMETSTPVRFPGSGLPASVPGDQDPAYTNRRSPSQSRWHRSVSSRHSTHAQPDFSAPATGIPDLMMQTLRVLVLFFRWKYFKIDIRLQDLHTAQLAAIDQQRESIHFMRELNERLERDFHDRRIETQRISENFDQLRDYITRPGPPFIYPGSQAQPFVMAPYLPFRHS